MPSTSHDDEHADLYREQGGAQTDAAQGEASPENGRDALAEHVPAEHAPVEDAPVRGAPAGTGAHLAASGAAANPLDASIQNPSEVGSRYRFPSPISARSAIVAKGSFIGSPGQETPVEDLVARWALELEGLDREGDDREPGKGSDLPKQRKARPVPAASALSAPQPAPATFARRRLPHRRPLGRLAPESVLGGLRYRSDSSIDSQPLRMDEEDTLATAPVDDLLVADSDNATVSSPSKDGASLFGEVETAEETAGQARAAADEHVTEGVGGTHVSAIDSAPGSSLVYPEESPKQREVADRIAGPVGAGLIVANRTIVDHSPAVDDPMPSVATEAEPQSSAADTAPSRAHRILVGAMPQLIAAAVLAMLVIVGTIAGVSSPRQSEQTGFVAPAVPEAQQDDTTEQIPTPAPTQSPELTIPLTPVDAEIPASVPPPAAVTPEKTSEAPASGQTQNQSTPPASQPGVQVPAETTPPAADTPEPPGGEAPTDPGNVPGEGGTGAGEGGIETPGALLDSVIG